MPGSSHRPRSERRPFHGRLLRRPPAAATPARTWEQEVAEGRAAAVGRLASGVAHELNNPLTIILGSVYLALEAMPANHPLAPQLRAIERAANRSRSLLRLLLRFSRPSPLDPEEFDLGAALSNAAALVEPLARYRSLEVLTDIGPRRMPLGGQEGDLQIALVHLTGHLIDCASPGGTLKVWARPTGPWADVRLVREAGGAAPGARTGRPEPVGLSLATQIIRRYGGSLEADGGAAFRLRLPLLEVAGDEA